MSSAGHFWTNFDFIVAQITSPLPSLTDYNLDSSADKDLKLYCGPNHHNNCSISLKRPTMISAVSTAVVGALDWNCCDHMTSSEWGGVGRAVDVWHWYGSVGFQPFVDLLLPIYISSLSSLSAFPLPWPFWHSELLQMRWCRDWHSVMLQPKP